MEEAASCWPGGRRAGHPRGRRRGGPPPRASPPPWWWTSRPADPGATGTVLVYGHYDKQPPFDGWTGGRGPWTPVLEGDRLYARGVADDGYALPSALVALEAVAAAGGRHGRCVVVAEGSEESGSPHLPDVLGTWPTGSGYPTWWWRSTRAAPPTTGCGSPPRSAGRWTGR